MEGLLILRVALDDLLHELNLHGRAITGMACSTTGKKPVVRPMRSLRVSSGKSLEPRILRLRAECFAADDEVHVDQGRECQREAAVLVQAEQCLLSVGAEDRKHAQHHRETGWHGQKHRQPKGQLPAQVRGAGAIRFVQAQQAGQALPVGIVQEALVAPGDHDETQANDEDRGETNVQHEGVAGHQLAEEKPPHKTGDEQDNQTAQGQGASQALELGQEGTILIADALRFFPLG